MSVVSAPSSVETTVLPPQNGPVLDTAPLCVPDDVLYEVVDGKIVERKDMGVEQAEIASILAQALGWFAKSNRLGRSLMDIVFRIDQAKNRQRVPDVAFVSHARWPVHRRVPIGPVWDLVPDLAIEVVSPTDLAYAVQKKTHEYFEAGVKQVWVVWPEQKEVYVYASLKQIQVLQLGDELDGGDLLPGFRLPLAALFEDEPENQ
jgi:Uma2 family endonuclease